jgi:hypothetical protein
MSMIGADVRTHPDAQRGLVQSVILVQSRGTPHHHLLIYRGREDAFRVRACFENVLEELRKNIFCIGLLRSALDLPRPFDWWARYLDQCELEAVEYTLDE